MIQEKMSELDYALSLIKSYGSSPNSGYFSRLIGLKVTSADIILVHLKMSQFVFLDERKIVQNIFEKPINFKMM